MPVTPPIIKVPTPPIQKIIGAVSRMEPPHSVVIQLNTFTAEGTAIASVTAINADRSRGSIPVANMWWAQTPNESTPMASVE